MKKILWLLTVFLLSLPCTGQSCLECTVKETKKKMKEFPEYSYEKTDYTEDTIMYLLYLNPKVGMVHYFHNGVSIATKIIYNKLYLKYIINKYDNSYIREFDLSNDNLHWTDYYQGEIFTYWIEIGEEELFSVWILNNKDMWFLTER